MRKPGNEVTKHKYLNERRSSLSQITEHIGQVISRRQIIRAGSQRPSMACCGFDKPLQVAIHRAQVGMGLGEFAV